MQELINELKDIQNKVPDSDMWVYDQYIQMAESKLEKEKEQICNAYTDGLEGPYIGAEEYYNQTYNTKQHIIDIMKADEDDGLYNQNK